MSGAVGEAYQGEQLHGPPAVAVALQIVRGHLDVLQGRGAAQQAVVLKNKADPRATQPRHAPVTHGGDRLTVQAIDARRGQIEAPDHVQQRRLAGTRRSDDGRVLAGIHLEVHSLQGRDVHLTHLVDLAHPDQFDQRAGGVAVVCHLVTSWQGSRQAMWRRACVGWSRAARQAG